MNMPPYLEKLASRYNALSLRERVLVACASLVALVMTWMLMVLDPIAAKQRALSAEKTSLEEQIGVTAQGIQDNPTVLAIAREKELQTTLAAINVQLADKSAGLIAPERMVQVIHDVLRRQQGVTLVSLHNKPVTSLVQAVPQTAEQAADAATTSDDGTTESAPQDAAPEAPKAPEMTGPFVHPVEIVVEGSYLDVLAYLKALEGLEWRFYWKVLDLETKRYPTNRVRIELSTLSMDKDWIGV